MWAEKTEESAGSHIVHTSNDDSGSRTRSGVNLVQSATYGGEPMFEPKDDLKSARAKAQAQSNSEEQWTNNRAAKFVGRDQA
jgi:hypothetical protein